MTPEERVPASALCMPRRAAPLRIGDAEDRRFENRGILINDGFELAGVDVLAARDDHVLRAVKNVEMAISGGSRRPRPGYGPSSPPWQYRRDRRSRRAWHDAAPVGSGPA